MDNKTLNFFKRKDLQQALSIMVDLGESDLRKGKHRTGKDCRSFLYAHYCIRNLRQGHTRALLAAYSIAQWSRSVEIKEHFNSITH